MSLLQLFWTFDIVLGGAFKSSNLRIIQAFLSICLCLVTKVLWYVTNAILHEFLKVPTINHMSATFYKILLKKTSSPIPTHITTLYKNISRQPNKKTEPGIVKRFPQKLVNFQLFKIIVKVALM